MTEPFPGARAKFRRAQEHAQTLKRKVRRFLKSNPYPVSKKLDSAAGQYEFRVKIARTPDWEEWGLLLGDYFHSLRAAFDHLAWQLRRGDAPLDDTITQFPIFDSPEKFRKHGLRQIQYLSPRAGTLVKCMQPYRRLAPGQAKALWVVHDFDVFDKHKVLAVTSSVLDEHTIELTVPPYTAVHYEIEVIAGAFEDGAVVATVIIDPPNPKVKVKGQPGFGIVFGKSGTPGEEQHLLIPTLDAITQMVDYALGVFERVAPRLHLDRGR
jgi:hypothetical protein